MYPLDTVYIQERKGKPIGVELKETVVIESLDKTRQDKTRQDKTRQDNARQDDTSQDTTRLDKTKTRQRQDEDRD